VRCNELLNILTFLMELPRRLCHPPKQVAALIDEAAKSVY
jgi:hypothetical protein